MKYLAAMLLLAAPVQADYCQPLYGPSKGYVCTPDKVLDYPSELVLIYNGDIDGESDITAQFVDYAPLPAVARIEVFMDGRRVFNAPRAVGGRFRLRNVYAESSIEINIWDVEGNYSQFIRLPATDLYVGYETGGIGVWWGK